MKSAYLQSVAATTGLTFHANLRTSAGKLGCVIGRSQGYLVSIYPIKDEQEGLLLNILVRLIGAEAQAKAAAIAEAVRKVASRQFVTAGTECLYIQCSAKPEAETVAKLLNEIVLAMRPLAPEWDGKCEICNAAAAREIALNDGVPWNFCSSCLEARERENQEHFEEYRKRNPNYLSGFLYGGAAAVGGALARGYTAYLFDIALWYYASAFFLGLFVSSVAMRSAGKTGTAVTTLVSLLTAASFLLSDVLYHTLNLSFETGDPMTVELLRQVVNSFSEFAPFEIVPILVALVGSTYWIYAMRYQAKHTIERIGSAIYGNAKQASTNR